MKALRNFYRKKKLGDNYLLTNDTGSHIVLSAKEYKAFLKDPGKQLAKRLIDAGMIATESNILDIKEKLKKRYSFLKQGPSLHIIITTLRCDLKCRYCHASSKPMTKVEYDMDEGTARNVVDMILKSSSENITIEFQGGEPLLNFDVIRFITKYIQKKNKNIMLTIVTNLTQMDQEKLDFLIKNKIAICTSLDGPKFLHNKQRQGYSHVVKWISIIQKIYKEKKIDHTRLNALVTITKDSLKYPKEIINEYRSHGFKMIHLRALNNLGNAKKIQNMSYTATEFIEFWKEAMDYILELNKKELFVERKTLVILKKIFDDYDPGYTDLRSPCGAVTGQLVYNHDGSVFTCDEGRMVEEELFRIGSVLDNYADITTNETSCSIIAASINDTQFCNKCAYKPYCGLCPVLNYAISGSIISNIAASDWCKVHMAQFDYIFQKLQDKGARKIFLEWHKKADIVSTQE